MAGRGGAAPYRKGAAHENLIVRAYRNQGCIAIRSPKSGTAIDVIAILPGGCVHLVQAKLAGYIRPAEREELVALAQQFGAEPILAYGKAPILRRNLQTGEQLDGLETADPNRVPASSDREVHRGECPLDAA